MPVTEGCARLHGDSRRLVLVTREWSAHEDTFVDESIERFFAMLRHTYVDVGEERASG